MSYIQKPMSVYPKCKYKIAGQNTRPQKQKREKKKNIHHDGGGSSKNQSRETGSRGGEEEV
jgi:hypothetical protein